MGFWIDPGQDQVFHGSSRLSVEVILKNPCQTDVSIILFPMQNLSQQTTPDARTTARLIQRMAMTIIILLTLAPRWIISFRHLL
jgi:hypothetical protein